MSGVAGTDRMPYAIVPAEEGWLALSEKVMSVSLRLGLTAVLL